MPMVLRLPGLSAAADPQKSRCSFPGEFDCAKLSTMMSKSRLSSRCLYCESSTTRIEALMPSA
jgi:hypothetical protein